MDAGKLNRRITIQQQSTTQDSYGGQVQSWSDFYACWAAIDIQQSQLIYATAEFISKVTYRISIRYTSSVVFAPNMRIIYTEPTTGVTHTYNIEAILNPTQGNVSLTFLCYELAGQE